MARKHWLGTSDRHARLRRIEALDLERDFREITQLFYGDFRSVMALYSFSGMMATYAAPRMSRILASTGESEHRVAKRVIDTGLFASTIMTHGITAPVGRDATRRVNAMHRRYNIHEDDFIVVGGDAAVLSLDLADRYGWRTVTEKEREAVRLYYSEQTRAFGGRRPLPPTIAAIRAFCDRYYETEFAFEPQNRRLADALLNWFQERVPVLARPMFRVVLLAGLDTRVLKACGYAPASSLARWAADRVMRLYGRKDPVPDDTTSMLDALALQIYPGGWTLDDLGGSHATPAGCPVHGAAPK